MSIEQLYTKGIPDIVETEGNVPRFTRICQEVHQHKLYSWNEIVPLVKKVTGFTHHNPVRRHIAAFTKLGILDQRDATYILSSEGRVLLELAKGKTFEERLTLPEKIFYFRAFFSNAFYQLFLFLQTIDQKHGLIDPKEMIADYFRAVLNSPLKIWQRDSLRRDIEIYELRDHLQKGLQNKFGCMKAWLRHLELLTGEGLALSPLGRAVVKNLESNGLDIGQRIFALANLYLTGRVSSLPVFNYSNDRHKFAFLELFDLAYSLFETQELGVSDAKSIRCFVCIKVLQDYHVTLEEGHFDNLLNDLTRSLRLSLMAGRNGKLAFISRFRG